MVSPELENPEVLRYLQETEDLAADPEKLWEELKKSYPKIQPFEYEDGCDILTIRPQDIGKLPRSAGSTETTAFFSTVTTISAT